MTKLKTAVIGAAGYTGAELVRLLVHHPACELVCLHSASQKGKRVDEVHGDLLGDCDLRFTDVVPTSGLNAVFYVFLMERQPLSSKVIPFRVLPLSLTCLLISETNLQGLCTVFQKSILKK